MQKLVGIAAVLALGLLAVAQAQNPKEVANIETYQQINVKTFHEKFRGHNNTALEVSCATYRSHLRLILVFQLCFCLL